MPTNAAYNNAFRKKTDADDKETNKKTKGKGSKRQAKKKSNAKKAVKTIVVASPATSASTLSRRIVGKTALSPPKGTALRAKELSAFAIASTPPSCFLQEERVKANNKVYSAAHKSEMTFRMSQKGTTMARAAALAGEEARRATAKWRALDA